MKTFLCLFEQSGTFKDCFNDMGYVAYDFDICNDYEKTDFIMDLFDLDNIDKIINIAIEENATLLMFYPCTYFSDQQVLWIQGNNYAQRNWVLSDKVIHSAACVNKLAEYYNTLCVYISKCIEFNIPLIIENPYSSSHFLTRYLPIKPAIIDRDRTRFNDSYKKPTQWYFINCSPSDNLHLILGKNQKTKLIQFSKYGKERSEISKDYAMNFIKSFILQE